MFGKKNQRISHINNSHYGSLSYSHTLKASRFFDCSTGNLVITGGNDMARVNALISAIRSERASASMPIVVFSDSAILMNSLIRLAQTESVGRVIVVSNEYKNYDLFSGMSATAITDIVASVASDKGLQNLNDIRIYCQAFLKVLATKEKLCLASMVAFSENSDADIAECARGGSNMVEFELISGLSKGGMDFRDVLNSIVNAVSYIVPLDRMTDFSISNALDEQCIIFINTSSHDRRIMARCFAGELDYLAGKRLSVVFHDCALLDDDRFKDAVNTLKRTGYSVMISTPNAASLGDDKYLVGFTRHIVFIGGSISSNDTQRLFDVFFGKYQHMETSESESEPSFGLFPSLHRTHTHSIQTYERSVVLLPDVSGCQAVVYGDYGNQITAVRIFKT